MTTSTLTRLAPTQVELEIPLSQEEVEAAQRRAFARLVQNVRLPGFRRGKVPRRLFEQTYGTEAIESEALDDVAPIAYERALREHDLDPVDRPKIEILPGETGKPARLKARVDVRPQIELGEYKGVTVSAPPVVISDEDVEHAMQSLARERATLVPVEREAHIGDAVTIDYEGRIEGETFEGGSAQRQQTELREDRYIPGFATGIAGMKPGETRNVEATFPADYARAEYAGKAAAFAVTLHEVKEIEIPAIDDEFAKSVSEAETVDALRAEVRKRLEAIAQGRRRRIVGNAVMEKLLARLEIPVPEVLVNREVESMIADAMQRARRAGVGFDEYLEQTGTTEEELRERYGTEALTQVKGTLVLEAIAKAEAIEATPAEVSSEVDSLARTYGQPPQAMRKAIGANLSSLRDGIVRGKAMDLLVDSANVEPGPTGQEPSESTEV